MHRKWQIRSESMTQAPLLDRLLACRGLTDPVQIETFLAPGLHQLHDPELLPDMDKACRTIGRVLRANQPVCIHGDYDVDGITATALLTRFLRGLGHDPQILIPDRLADGYGLSEDAAETLAATGCKLLITVDCGITSLEAIKNLRVSGIAVVVTDHHACGSCLPDADAVVNPHRADSRYPFSGLAGVGVALKLVQALCRELQCGDLWKNYLDLAALGTVADVVPLLDENRSLVAAGLDQINLGRGCNERLTHDDLPPSATPGLAVLIDAVSPPDRQVTAQLLGFTAAPRINAAGRMSDALDAVRLLLTESRAEAGEIAMNLIELNKQRQEIENAITRDAMAELDSQADLDEHAILVVARPDWHPGVIGIVASRLAEQYTRPVIVLAGDGALFRGSCRSWGDIDILAALHAASGALERYGGHRKAAGLTLAADQLDHFRSAIRAYARSSIRADMLQAGQRADLLVGAEELTLDQALQLRRLEPFGEGNPAPLFICKNLQIAETRLVGNGGRHLKIRLTSLPAGSSLDGIAFGAGDAGDWTGAGDRIDVCFSLEVNTWQGRRQVQLNIRDLWPADSGNAFDDRPWEAETLYRSEGNVRALMKRFSLPWQAVLPDKQEYKAVYQYLRTHCDEQAAVMDITLLSRKIGRSYQFNLHPFRLARILSVFAEAGLIKQQDLGQSRIRLTLLPVAGKVRLEDSPTYRRLAAEREGGSIP
ncbi:MAG: single-stranded-DNA-specific exonuclease RecJ [Clostridiaceae bacterium]|nr:single-stranded-DNA-specific exonuclease RecJ [Clostridiaceae bacterium]